MKSIGFAPFASSALLVIYTAVVKVGCLSGGPHRRVRLIPNTTKAFIHLEILEVHFGCAGSQNLLGASVCSSRPRSHCGAVHIFGLGAGHLPWQARALVVDSRLFVAGAGD